MYVSFDKSQATALALPKIETGTQQRCGSKKAERGAVRPLAQTDYLSLPPVKAPSIKWVT